MSTRTLPPPRQMEDWLQRRLPETRADADRARDEAGRMLDQVR